MICNIIDLVSIAVYLLVFAASLVAIAREEEK
jgi:hypothetical protein